MFQDEQDPITVLQALDECGYDGLWDWYPQDNREYYSQRFREILGFEDKHDFPDEPESWQKQIYPESLQIALHNYRLHVSTRGAHPYRQKVRYRHKTGREVHLLCRGKVIQWDKNWQPLRMVGTHTDITELTEARRETREAIQDLKVIQASLEKLSQ